jgi:hypothetical protein
VWLGIAQPRGNIALIKVSGLPERVQRRPREGDAGNTVDREGDGVETPSKWDWWSKMRMNVWRRRTDRPTLLV